MIEWGPISITALLQILAWIGGLVFAWASVKADIFGLKKDIQKMEDSLKQLSHILTQVAVQDTRLAMVEKHIDELRHGQGFINAPEKAVFAA